eukprot:728284_1
MIPSKTDSNLGVKEYLRDIPLVLKVLLFFSVAVNIIFAYKYYSAQPVTKPAPAPADPFVVTKEFFEKFQRSQLDDESQKKMQNLVDSMYPGKGRFESTSTFLDELLVEMLKKKIHSDTYNGFKDVVTGLTPNVT